MSLKNKVFQFKLVLLGEQSVGKSSLVLRFVKQEFREFQETTIGAAYTAFTTQKVEFDDTTIKFEIWDTAGQERYRSLAPMYYRSAQAALIVYDITDRNSFAKAKNWIIEVKRQANENIVIALVGNKLDLESKRSVENNEAKLFANENNLLFMETSAKTAINVIEVFTSIATCLSTNKINDNKDDKIKSKPFKIKSINQKKNKCC